jgi:hypothetical protein
VTPRDGNDGAGGAGGDDVSGGVQAARSSRGQVDK